jgi:integrase/recombinase XerC
MKVHIESMDYKNFSSLESYATQKLSKSLGQFSFITSAHVYFKEDQDGQHSKRAKVQLNVKNDVLFAELLADRFDAALDNTIQKLKRQIQKYKTKKFAR